MHVGVPQSLPVHVWAQSWHAPQSHVPVLVSHVPCPEQSFGHFSCSHPGPKFLSGSWQMHFPALPSQTPLPEHTRSTLELGQDLSLQAAPENLCRQMHSPSEQTPRSGPPHSSPFLPSLQALRSHSGPAQPVSHVQISEPGFFDPCAPHERLHGVPLNPGEHLHIPLTHSPNSPQSILHALSAQFSPAHPSAHTHAPFALSSFLLHFPWPEHPSGHL